MKIAPVALFSTCFALSMAAAQTTPSTGNSARAAKPNVMVILADDMGFSDIGAYGSEIQTPNIDALASSGVCFSQFHNTARCCPTRASLLTGLYPHQAGLARNDSSLNRNGATIAEHLQAAAYSTGMVGKWHLSSAGAQWQQGSNQMAWLNHQYQHEPFSAPWTYPFRRGFQEHYGTIWGVGNYFDPFSLVRNDKAVLTVPGNYYYTDAITTNATQFIDQFAQAGKPFFMYVAYTAAHWPLHARPEDVAKYANTYTVGWDSIRAARYRRQVQKGLFPANTATLSQMVQDTPWTSAANKAWRANNMAVHAAMVDRMDQGIGAIIQKLKDLGQYDNTLILFLSDNGASPERYQSAGFDRPSQLRDGTSIQYTGTFTAGPANTWGYIGPMWANAANTPFRYWKKESYEGGICTPLIAHWPAGITAAPGSIHRQTGHVVDLLPTILEATGIAYPQNLGGHKLLPTEGMSLLPALNGGAPKARILFWEHEGGRAAVSGDWKIVSLSGQAWELYNLATDRTETNNLAAANTAKRDSLVAAWNAWNTRVNNDARIGVTVALFNPGNGATWSVGNTYSLQWMTTGGANIRTAKLEYNPGSGWRSIADSTAHDGEFAWTVPAGVTGTFQVRVTVLDDAGAAHIDTKTVNVGVPVLGAAHLKTKARLGLERQGGTLLISSEDPSTVRDLSGKRTKTPQTQPPR